MSLNNASFAYLKGWLTGFFLGLIVFMGCSLACVHAWFFLKTHYLSHNYLYSTPLCPFSDNASIYSWFYEAPPSEIRDGLRLVSWLSVVCDWLKTLPSRAHLTSPPLSSATSLLVWIVNSGVVFNAYQFEPDWDPEDISEEDCAEPVQARLLIGMFGCCCLIL